MPIFKRKDSPYWWTRFTVGGRRVRCSTETTDRREAAEFETRLREREWNRAHAGHRTWQEASARWLHDNDQKKSLDRDREIIKWTLGDAGHPRLRELMLHEITRDVLDDLRREKAETVARSTANRYMACIRAILKAAADEWEWLDKAPKAPMYPQAPAEYQWLTRAEFIALLPLLPPLTQQLAKFAVATGLRRTNITHLRWSQIDDDRKHMHVASTESKSAKAIPVPVNLDAQAVLAAQEGKHPVWVFPYHHGRPIYQVSTKAWQRAVKAIGRPGFRFHDLRHTWASWHIQAGTPLHALQALGGWSEPKMVQRYAHLDSRSLRDYAASVSIPWHVSGTPEDQGEENAA